MVKNILIVDDDQDMLLSLREGLEKFKNAFSVMIAGDGLMAAQKLKKNTISLVVTDLKMPRMDGFTLLSHIMEHYPYIPVIIMTAYSTPKMKQMAKRSGAVGYIEKPFLVADLARQATATLRKESEGGTLHSVSSGMFLQLIEMEERTCTIRLADKSSGKHGILFFQNGELIDAKTEESVGEIAAHEIFSWDKVNLSIQNDCVLKKRRILSDLQAIFLHAMQLKDEAAPGEDSAPDAEIVEEIETISEQEYPETLDSIHRLWIKLEKAVGKNGDLDNIYHDDSWNSLVAQFNVLGKFFNAGRFMVSYIDKGQSKNFILLPDKETTVITVDPKSPRDKILQILSI